MSRAPDTAPATTRPSPAPPAPAPPAPTPPRGGSPGGRARRARRGRRLGIAIAVGALVASSGYAVEAAGDEQEALGPGVVTVEVGIHHSRFDIGDLRVHEGTLIRFVVRNDDPIDHELVVGARDVHRRHADGTERRHPPVPGEVSVAPGEVGMTFYELTELGTVVYACHLPGHLAYGMAGEIEVVPV